jgi:hypothetical protein
MTAQVAAISVDFPTFMVEPFLTEGHGPPSDDEPPELVLLSERSGENRGNRRKIRRAAAEDDRFANGVS